MSGIPIRVRLTIAFAAAMVCVIGAMAVLVYVRVGGALLTSVDQTLRAQAREGLAHAHDEHELIDPDAASGVTLAQVVNAAGRPVKSSQPGLQPLLARPDASRSAHGTTLLRTVSLQRPRGEWRVLAEPVPSGGAIVVAAVAGRERRGAAPNLSRAPHRRSARGAARVAGRLRARGGRPAPGRADATAGRERDAVIARAAAGHSGTGRDLASRDHAQRHALAAARSPRTRASVRRRCQPRTANAGRSAAHRARARAAAASIGRGAHACDPVGARRDRAPLAVGRRPAAPRAGRGRLAAVAQGANRPARPLRRSRCSVRKQGARVRPACHGRRRPPPSSKATPSASSRRSTTSSTTRSPTAAARSRSSRRPRNGAVELHVADHGAGFDETFLDPCIRPLQPRRRGARTGRSRARAFDRAVDRRRARRQCGRCQPAERWRRRLADGRAHGCLTTCGALMDVSYRAANLVFDGRCNRTTHRRPAQARDAAALGSAA